MSSIKVSIRYSIWVVAAMTLWACSDHRIPAVIPGLADARLRIKTITDVSGILYNPDKVSLFQYDSRGRLSTILAYQVVDSSKGPVERSDYQYDSQNRLILHQHQIKRPLFFTGTTEYHRISYRENGQVATIEYYNDTDSPGTPILIFTATPQFNSANKLQSYQKILSPFVNSSGVVLRADKVLSTISFTGDNLTSYHFQGINNDLGSSIATVDSDITLTYDDKLNPFYGLYFIPAPRGYIINIRNGNFSAPYYYGGLDSWLTLSRNNALSSESTNAPSVTTYQYTYNPANLPTSRTIVVSSGVAEKLTFEYESY
ncbi:hypothetical protein [Spirosoma sp.]|uniref:hypothetical protein n=1 Tax=Spirosoma sp. TaxID=1899569 RepID=UPI003B3A0967